MTLKVVNRLDHNLWKKFVDSHPHGNIFHTPEMFEVYSNTIGYKPSLWAVVDDEEILALHTPVIVTLRGGLLHYLTTRSVSFGSVLVRHDERGRQALAVLLEKYNKNVNIASLFTELRHASDQSYFADIFESYGYQYESYLNYFVDLDRDEYDILQSLSRSARRNIRATIRNEQVTVKEISKPDMLPIFYELIKKTYSHARIPLADFSLFKATFDLLVPKKMARFTICFANGIPSAAAVNLHYKDVVYGWYNGMDRELGSYYPNEMGIWETLSWGANNGFKVFDFGGAGKPDEESGVREFKLKFKGELVEFGRNTCVHAPVRMKMAENMYKMSRNAILSFRQMTKKVGSISS